MTEVDRIGSSLTADQRREHLEPDELLDDDAGDPAAAFEALRASVSTLSDNLQLEMTTIRKGVEAAFDQLERRGTSIDYSADLGRISQQLSAMVERMEGLEKTPLLRQGAEHYARVLERSGEGLVRSAVYQLEQQAFDLERINRNLSASMDGARERRRQNWWLASTGGAGIVIGVLFTLFAPRVLPEGTVPIIASAVMGETVWDAGMKMMMFASPETWGRVVSADRLIEANKGAVADCKAAAAKAGKEQKCVIVVPAGEGSR
jgi:hypothetical protein